MPLPKLSEITIRFSGEWLGKIAKMKWSNDLIQIQQFSQMPLTVYHEQTAL